MWLVALQFELRRLPSALGTRDTKSVCLPLDMHLVWRGVAIWIHARPEFISKRAPWKRVLCETSSPNRLLPVASSRIDDHGTRVMEDFFVCSHHAAKRFPYIVLSMKSHLPNARLNRMEDCTGQCRYATESDNEIERIATCDRQYLM